jgi:hypothetical protein
MNNPSWRNQDLSDVVVLALEIKKQNEAKKQSKLKKVAA